MGRVRRLVSEGRSGESLRPERVTERGRQFKDAQRRERDNTQVPMQEKDEGQAPTELATVSKQR